MVEKYKVKTIADTAHHFVYPFVAVNASMVFWRHGAKLQLKEGIKDARKALHVLHLLYK
jgi:anthranilate phosphoribosyltransferase